MAIGSQIELDMGTFQSVTIKMLDECNLLNSQPLGVRLEESDREVNAVSPDLGCRMIRALPARIARDLPRGKVSSPQVQWADSV